MNMNEILKKIRKEVRSAEEDWPAWPRCKFHQCNIMIEEAGEATRALNEAHNENSDDLFWYKKELIQTAAMCVRILKNLE